MPFKEVFETLSLLTPFDVPDDRKVRIGARHDGGYVMLDRFRPAQRVFSYGLSWNIAFERDLAERGHSILMFDHTIEALASEHQRFRWFKEGLAAQTRHDLNLFSLVDHVARLAPAETDMILKLDVEGAEWAALADMPVELICRFEQVVLELHDLRLMDDPAWRTQAARALDKLARHFTLHHVHANNYAPLSVVAGLTVADVIEVSYVRSDTVRRQPSSTLFPSHLDAANNPLLPDVPLWFFPFMPTGSLGDDGAIAEALGAAASRIDQAVVHAQLQDRLQACLAQDATTATAASVAVP